MAETVYSTRNGRDRSAAQRTGAWDPSSLSDVQPRCLQLRSASGEDEV